MLVPIKLSPVWARKEFGTLSLEFPSFKAFPPPAAVTNIYRHTLSCCSLISWEYGCAYWGFSFLQITLGARFISLTFEMTDFLSNLPNDETFSDGILYTKADLLQVLTGNLREKKLFKLTFHPPFIFLNIIALKMWGLSPKVNSRALVQHWYKDYKLWRSEIFLI